MNASKLISYFHHKYCYGDITIDTAIGIGSGSGSGSSSDNGNCNEGIFDDNRDIQIYPGELSIYTPKGMSRRIVEIYTKIKIKN